MLLVFGAGNIRAASTRARSPGVVQKLLAAGSEAADAGKAVIDCRERERMKASNG
jgi:hypothetical protein